MIRIIEMKFLIVTHSPKWVFIGFATETIIVSAICRILCNLPNLMYFGLIKSYNCHFMMNFFEKGNYKYEFSVFSGISKYKLGESGSSIDPLNHIGKSRKLFPKNVWWLRGFLGNFFQTFFRFCNFGARLRGFSGNFFQVNFMSTYPWKNIFSQKRVMTQRLFRKLFPISGKSFRKFSWVITRIYEISNFI